jgi:phosphonopyruvate decarboxylase
MMQNSGLGNAVNPLSSLTYVFRVPVLLIITLRGDPLVHDEPQHHLMGRITGQVLEMLSIPWEYFPTQDRALGAVLARAEAFMAQEGRPYALVLRKGTIARHERSPRFLAAAQPRESPAPQGALRCPAQERPQRSDVLRRVVDLTPVQGTVVVATAGYTGRELCTIADRPNHLYIVGAMGCASSLALGLSAVRPDLRVIVVDGDGAALMRMGNLATIGAYGGPNLIHLLLDNEVHDSTGGQATVSSRVSFAAVAHACGYGLTILGDDLSVVDILFRQRPSGPSFAHLKTRPGTLPQLPRPTLTPVQVCERFKAHIGSRSRVFAAESTA